MPATSSDKKTIFLVGGTGAQGFHICKNLLEDRDGKPTPYHVKALTRNPDHRRAKEIAELGVELVKGDAFDFTSMRKLLDGVYGLFVNTDFFTVGDEGETYGGIRLYELARYAGVRHFVWSNLDYASKLGNWKEEYACDHHDAKGRVGDFLSVQDNRLDDPKSTLYTILTTAGYMDMLNAAFTPLNVREDGTVVFAAPMGKGHAPLLALKDMGWWVRKVFDNHETMTGKELRIASDVVTWQQIADTFTKVTGRPAEYKDMNVDEFWDLFVNVDLSAAPRAVRETGSWRKTFGGFYAIMRDDLMKRDMEWVKSVHPETLSLEQWMRDTQYDGGFRALLKLVEDANMSMYPNMEKCVKI